MGSHRNSYCVVSCYDASEYARTGIRPNCAHHEHLSKTKVNELTRTLLFTKKNIKGEEERVYEFTSLMKSELDRNPSSLQAIVEPDPMAWSIRRSGGFAGYEVHQLIHQGR